MGYMFRLTSSHLQPEDDSCESKHVAHKQNKLRGLSPHANYTDRAAAAGRRS